VVDPKKDNWKKGGPRRRKGTRGRWPPQKKIWRRNISPVPELLVNF
jgi:hypothetical protein